MRVVLGVGVRARAQVCEVQLAARHKRLGPHVLHGYQSRTITTIHMDASSFNFSPAGYSSRRPDWERPSVAARDLSNLKLAQNQTECRLIIPADWELDAFQAFGLYLQLAFSIFIQA